MREDIFGDGKQLKTSFGNIPDTLDPLLKGPDYKKIDILYFPQDKSASMRSVYNDFSALPLTPAEEQQQIALLREYMARSAMGQDILDHIDANKIQIKLKLAEFDIIPEGSHMPKLGAKNAEVTIGHSRLLPSLAQQALILAHEVFHNMQHEKSPWLMLLHSQDPYMKQMSEIGAIGFQNMFAAEHMRATGDNGFRWAADVTNAIQRMPADTFGKFLAGDYQAAMRDAFISVFTHPRKDLGYLGEVISKEERQEIETLHGRLAAEGTLKGADVPEKTKTLIRKLGNRLMNRPDHNEEVRAMAGIRLPKSGIAFNYLDGIDDAHFADEEKFTLLDPAFEKKVRALDHALHIAPFDKYILKDAFNDNKKIKGFYDDLLAVFSREMQTNKKITITMTDGSSTPTSSTYIRDILGTPTQMHTIGVTAMTATGITKIRSPAKS